MTTALVPVGIQNSVYIQNSVDMQNSVDIQNYVDLQNTDRKNSVGIRKPMEQHSDEQISDHESPVTKPRPNTAKMKTVQVFWPDTEPENTAPGAVFWNHPV